MSVIFKIKSNHKSKDRLVNNITKYLDVSHNNSNNTSPEKSLDKYIEYKINSDKLTNLEHIYKDISILTKNTSGPNEVVGIQGTYKTVNEKIKLKIGSFISKGTYGNVHNAVLINNTSQKSVLLNRVDDLDVRMTNIKELNVIVKSQVIKKGHPTVIKKILTEYLIHLLINYNKKTTRFIPKMYTVFRYKNHIFYIMEKLEGNTLDHFISKQKQVNNNNSDTSHVNYNIQFIDYFKQLTMILYILQKYFNFVHGDMKPNNIILVPTNKTHITINGNKIATHGHLVKIIDFGFACIQSNKMDNIIVPTHTYNNMICNKSFIDLLFIIIRIVRKSFGRRYNIPPQFNSKLRKYLKALFETVHIKEKHTLTIGDNSNYKCNHTYNCVHAVKVNSKSNMSVINASKSKVEYRIIQAISTNYDKYKTKHELLVFNPSEMFKVLTTL